MTNDIAVSVIIPVYNAAPYLRQCLDSVVNQTLHDIEVICVDDGSTDESLDILREHERADGRVRVLTQHHQGPGTARNTGMDVASGKYLYIMDSDDFINLRALEALYHSAVESNANVVLFNTFFYHHETGIFETGGDEIDITYLPDQDIFSAFDAADGLFQCVGGHVWNKFFNRAFVLDKRLRFPDGKYALDDLPFVYAAMAFAHRIMILDWHLYYHRKSRDGCSFHSEGNKHHPGRFYDSCLALKKSLITHGVYDIFRRSFVNIALRTLLNALSLNLEVFDRQWRSLCASQFSELDITGHPREYFYIQPHYEWLKLITANEPSEDVLYELRMIGYGNPPFPTGRVQRDSDIVLYGAGEVGRKYHEWLSCSKYCNVVLWLDRKAKELWPPITEPSAIVDARYDQVVIAVGDMEISRAIGKDLVERYGVDPTRLIYVN